MSNITTKQKCKHEWQGSEILSTTTALCAKCGHQRPCHYDGFCVEEGCECTRFVIALGEDKDAQPIDETWLREIGFHKQEFQGDEIFFLKIDSPNGDDQWIESSEMGSGIFTLNRYSGLYSDGTPPDRVAVKATTRGQLRALLRCLINSVR